MSLTQFHWVLRWVTAGNFTKDGLIDVIKAHIKGVAGHYKGIPATWDVVNEALNVRLSCNISALRANRNTLQEDGTMRSSVFYDTIGVGYIDIAFQTALEVDPDASLAINGTSASVTLERITHYL